MVDLVYTGPVANDTVLYLICQNNAAITKYGFTHIRTINLGRREHPGSCIWG
jgi:hypothetical protein